MKILLRFALQKTPHFPNDWAFTSTKKKKKVESNFEKRSLSPGLLLQMGEFQLLEKKRGGGRERERVREKGKNGKAPLFKWFWQMMTGFPKIAPPPPPFLSCNPNFQNFFLIHCTFSSPPFFSSLFKHARVLWHIPILIYSNTHSSSTKAISVKVMYFICARYEYLF